MLIFICKIFKIIFRVFVTFSAVVLNVLGLYLGKIFEPANCENMFFLVYITIMTLLSSVN